MDIDSMVKKLMDANRIPLTKLNQQKTTLTWQRDAYRAVNTKISDFRNVAFDMKLSSSFSNRKAVSDADDAISVSGTATATEGVYQIQVKQVAETARLTSSGPVGAKAKSGVDTKLQDLGLTAGTTLTIAGEKGSATVTVKKDDTLDTLVRSINNKANSTGVRVSYDATLDHFFFSSTGTGSAAKVDLQSDDSSLINNVFKLATPNTVTGSKAFANASTPIDSALAAPQSLRIAYDGKTKDFTVDATTDMNSLINDINNSDIGKTGVKAYLDANNKLAFNNPDSSKSITFVNPTTNDSDIVDSLGLTTTTSTNTSARTGNLSTGTVTFADGVTTKINDKYTADQKLRIAYDGKTVDFTVNATTQIGSLIDQINSSDIGKKGVTAYLDANNKLAFTTPDSSKSITISDETSDSKNVVDDLGMSAPTVTTRNTSGTVNSGKDAIIEYNGVQGTYSTNTFSINGLNFTAKKVMTAASNITVSQDTDAIYDKIKNFVDKYNEMIGSINTTLDEKKYSNFAPLTDEQRSSMKEDEITQWEAKAKSGLLRNDQMISSALNGFRLALSSDVAGLPSGDLKKLSQIGITTGTYSEKGKLYIDPTALKKAIAEHPEEVAALFTATDGGNKTSNTSDGLATRLVEQADNLMANLKTKAGTASSVDTTYTMGKSLKDYDKRISTLTTKLDDMETKYYNQFSAMEKYINQMNAQSAYMSQQFGTN
ncbi:flagellar filament capping protein FliD [Cohnella sp. 56]|uniref:flagellar filament capping protein FliD n=1 Tax=Cohnella sp. 56 TaxID=3113722 RepID=UPI0030E89E28